MLILDPAEFTIATSSDNAIFYLKGTMSLSKTLTQKIVQKNLIDVSQPIHIGIGFDDKKNQIQLIFDKKYKQIAKYTNQELLQFNNIGFIRHLASLLKFPTMSEKDELIQFRYDLVEFDNENKVILKYGAIKVK